MIHFVFNISSNQTCIYASTFTPKPRLFYTVKLKTIIINKIAQISTFGTPRSPNWAIGQGSLSTRDHWIFHHSASFLMTLSPHHLLSSFWVTIGLWLLQRNMKTSPEHTEEFYSKKKAEQNCVVSINISVPAGNNKKDPLLYFWEDNAESRFWVLLS